MINRMVIAPVVKSFPNRDKGKFGLDWGLICSWNRCRDYFYDNYYFHNNFFYKFSSSYYVRENHKSSAENISNLLAHIEEVLDWKHKSKVHSTQHKDIIYIRPSRNWSQPIPSFPFTQNSRNRRIKRSPLTAVIRIGESYENHEESPTINGIIDGIRFSRFNYLRHSGKAFKRFLQGNTYYSNRFSGGGWCDLFNDKYSSGLGLVNQRSPKQRLIDSVVFWK